MRWTIALLALFSLSFIAGCGGEPPPPPKGSEESATTLDVESGDVKTEEKPAEAGKAK